MSRTVLMQGNEACVEGAIAAGMRLFAGYPITPSTEIAEVSAQRLPALGGRFIQMEDEISSMAVVIGASVAGVKAMTATSGPGFSLKQENIGYAAMTEIPCVIVDVQRAGPSTGRSTSPAQGDVMQARWGTHGDHPVIALSPSSVEETYGLIIRAFNLSEKYRTPVIFLMDEIVGHLREDVRLPEPGSVETVERSRVATDDPPYYIPEGEWAPHMPPFGCGQRYHITGLTHGEDGFPTNSPAVAEKLIRRLMGKIEQNRADIITVDGRCLDDAEVAVVCYGGTARAAMEAVSMARAEGIRAGMLRLVTIWPFAEEQVKALAGKVKRVVVAEHNCGQLLLEVQRVCGGSCEVDFIGRMDGEVIPPADILAKLREAR